ncbi:MAG TPA: RNase H family protein [Micromonosporaceae bacterium]
MRLDEFERDVNLLPEPLRERAKALRVHLHHPECERCARITEETETALLAARYDQLTAVDQLIARAEKLAHGHQHPTVQEHRSGEPPTAHFRRRDAVPHWSEGCADLVAATDASWKSRTHGIGYVISDGRFGLHGWPTTWVDPTGPARVLVDELRAVEFLLSGITDRETPLTVLVDSVPALTYLDRWRAGDLCLPDDYSLRPGMQGAKATLMRLAELVADLPNVSFEHVESHTGHPLNEAADALARMARRRVRERFDVRTRAADLVDAFLRDWHTHHCPAPRPCQRQASQPSAGSASIPPESATSSARPGSPPPRARPNHMIGYPALQRRYPSRFNVCPAHTQDSGHTDAKLRNRMK